MLRNGGTSTTSAIVDFLDGIRSRLVSGDIDGAMGDLVRHLHATRAELSRFEWRHVVEAVYLQHPVAHLIWQDPITEHSFRKPRGYTGDADLFDFFYGNRLPGNNCTELGRKLYAFNHNSGLARSVRNQRDLLVAKIDEAADRFSDLRVLSIACGHLREAGSSTALALSKIREFAYLDSDPAAIRTVCAEHDIGCLKPIQGSARGLIAGTPALSGYHLVYATGLYDYLPDAVAKRLAEVMFDMAAPGGRVIISNFAADTRFAGYMESFMAWQSFYRSENEMLGLLEHIAPKNLTRVQTYRDANQNIVFLDMTKTA